MRGMKERLFERQQEVVAIDADGAEQFPASADSRQQQTPQCDGRNIVQLRLQSVIPTANRRALEAGHKLPREKHSKHGDLN